MKVKKRVQGIIMFFFVFFPPVPISGFAGIKRCLKYSDMQSLLWEHVEYLREQCSVAFLTDARAKGYQGVLQLCLKQLTNIVIPFFSVRQGRFGFGVFICFLEEGVVRQAHVFCGFSWAGYLFYHSPPQESNINVVLHGLSQVSVFFYDSLTNFSSSISNNSALVSDGKFSVAILRPSTYNLTVEHSYNPYCINIVKQISWLGSLFCCFVYSVLIQGYFHMILPGDKKVTFCIISVVVSWICYLYYLLVFHPPISPLPFLKKKRIWFFVFFSTCVRWVGPNQIKEWQGKKYERKEGETAWSELKFHFGCPGCQHRHMAFRFSNTNSSNKYAKCKYS